MPTASPEVLEGTVLSDATAHAQFMTVVTPAFARFVHLTMASAMEKCAHDVAAMTRYVSWDFQSPSKDALQSCDEHRAVACHSCSLAI